MKEGPESAPTERRPRGAAAVAEDVGPRSSGSRRSSPPSQMPSWSGSPGCGGAWAVAGQHPGTSCSLERPGGRPGGSAPRSRSGWTQPVQHGRAKGRDCPDRASRQATLCRGRRGWEGPRDAGRQPVVIPRPTEIAERQRSRRRSWGGWRACADRAARRPALAPGALNPSARARTLGRRASPRAATLSDCHVLWSIAASFSSSMAAREQVDAVRLPSACRLIRPMPCGASAELRSACAVLPGLPTEADSPDGLAGGAIRQTRRAIRRRGSPTRPIAAIAPLCRGQIWRCWPGPVHEASRSTMPGPARWLVRPPARSPDRRSSTNERAQHKATMLARGARPRPGDDGPRRRGGSPVLEFLGLMTNTPRTNRSKFAHHPSARRAGAVAFAVASAGVDQRRVDHPFFHQRFCLR